MATERAVLSPPPMPRGAEEIAESSLLRQVPGGGASWTRLARAALRPSVRLRAEDFSLVRGTPPPPPLPPPTMMMMLIEVAHKPALLKTDVSGRQERNGDREKWDLAAILVFNTSSMEEPNAEFCILLLHQASLEPRWPLVL